MRIKATHSTTTLFGAAIAIACATASMAQTLTGRDAFGDWRADRPGVTRLITAKDLPAPWATPSAANVSHVVARPAAATPQVPDGFEATLFADGLSGPRIIRVAPNGDVFVAETRSNRVRLLRSAEGEAKPSVNEIYASDLNRP